MRAAVQRVSRAAVRVGTETIGQIDRGLLVLLGIGKSDTEADADWMINKLLNLRIFPDENSKMNRSVTDIGGDILVVSQFTLYGDVRRGFRPSFTDAMPPADAEKFYNNFMAKLRGATSLKIAEGRFAAMMDVELVNDGPVTIILENVGRASSLSPSQPAETVRRASSLSPSDPASPETSDPPVLQPFDSSASVGNSRRYMPHWTQPGCTYFVTFRLADSVPMEKLRQWSQLTDRDLVREEIQQWLDKGTGQCLLRRPEVAGLVANALRHFDGQRYHLGPFIVMPNHVHLLVTPLPRNELSAILHSWKSYTANQINRLLGQSGPVWQRESFDHIVRDEEALLRFEQYIRDNPRSACLKEGEYVVGP